MARRKTITRDQILHAAYEVVANEGFSKFTARNIATEMNCSTQPIYLEFKNMDDLKGQLFDRIHQYLANEIFPVEHTGNAIVDLALNYIHFAKDEPKLYRALYLEEYGGGQIMQEFSYNYFTATVKKDSTYAELTDDEINTLHMGTWILATGIAALMTSGIIKPTDEQIEHLMLDSIKQIQNSGGLIEIS